MTKHDTFTATLCHEMSNALWPLTTGVEMLMQEDDPATLKSARDLLGRQVRVMRRLLDDLLEHYRMRGGATVLCCRRVDLAEFAAEVCGDYRAEIAEVGLQLKLKLPGRPVWVNADPVRLTQVLGNLLRNAMKFTRAGGEIKVTVSVDDEEGRGVVSVADTGIGIEPRQLPRLFEPFFQTDAGRSAVRAGLGLGLPLARTLVELHGGEVSAHSAGLGQGSEFMFWIPLDQPLDS